MASDHNARDSTGAGHASAEALHVEDGQSPKDKTGSDSTPPRAGRTGSLGTKAERPAENRARKSEGDAEPARGGKPPSPAADDNQRDHLPRPVRDLTG